MAEHYKYSQTQIEALRSTSMHAVLASLGYNTKHTSGGLYFSPFRNERTPSFHINETEHKWYDHGDPSAGLGGKAGGDTISLVQKLRNCSFYDALKYLGEMNPSIYPVTEEDIISTSNRPSSATSSGLTIDTVTDRIMSHFLEDYVVNVRHIPLPIVERYCKQVNYTCHFTDRKTGKDRSMHRYAIGFRNIDGNWALRSPMKFKGKISTGNNYTVILSDGTMPLRTEDGIMAPSHRTVAVFEGFFDFLSFMAWTEKDVPGNCDMVVLNGVSNTHRALDFICSHEVVVTYLDNDKKSGTGEKFSDYIEKECDRRSETGQNISYHNKSSAFNGCNDLNDAWVAECRKRQMEALQKAEKERQSRIESKVQDNGCHPHIK